MKKTIFLLLGVVLISGLCYADEHASSPKTAGQNVSVKVHMAQGTIESITPADATNKVDAGLSIKEDNGSVVKFILSNAAVMGADLKNISFSQLKAGEKVKVKYSPTKDGANRVRVITEIK